MKKKYIVIGVDEAGRGPLAGPISVGAVAATANLKSQNKKLLKNIRDSKKLSVKKREEWLKVIKKNFEYHCSMVGPQIIDRLGIQKATRLATAKALRNLIRNKLRNKNPDLVLLDGQLYAPKQYNQKTIIKGDEKVPLIAAASIVAKVLRDKKMRSLHKLSPEYCFDIHKGYGTKLHYRLLKKNGVSKHHRKCFLKKKH